MKRFEIGEKVVALITPDGDSFQSMEKGKIYKILEVMYCSKCGIQLVYIGGTTRVKCSNQGRCICQALIPMNLPFTNSKYFAKIDEDSLQEAVKEEEYEIAAVLRDNLILKT